VFVFEPDGTIWYLVCNETGNSVILIPDDVRINKLEINPSKTRLNQKIKGVHGCSSSYR
jgi:hypothetical protein